MKIIFSDGCTSYAIIADDKSIYDYPIEDIAELLTKRIKDDLIAGKIDIHQALNIIDPDTVEYGETCEQCGDYVVTQTWDI